MYIQPCDNNVNMQGLKDWSKYIQRLKQKALDALPDATFNDSNANRKAWNKFSDMVSRPMENRILMGATAILTQPVIDYHNNKVDKETREVSRNRTIAKIIAGTASGILVRGSSQYIIEKLTDTTAKTRFRKSFLPEKHIGSLLKTVEFLKNYRNTLSTILAILAMCITNFVIDAPLTLFLTNHLNAKTKEKKLEKAKGGNK